MSFTKAKWVVSEKYCDLKPLDIRKKGRLNQNNDEHTKDQVNDHTLFRMKFENIDSKNTILRYSADDIAKIYVNGYFIDMGPAPAYHFKLNYNEFDITPYLKKGRNVIAAHVYYMGELNRVFPSGDFRVGFICEVIQNEAIIAYTDENTKQIESKAYGTNGMIGYKTQYTELFNANEWDYNWASIDCDESSWENACIKKYTDYNLAKQITKPLDFYGIYPKTSKRINENIVQYDLGEEYAGNVYFQMKGKKGDTITVYCGEELEGERVRYEMRCNCTYISTHTISSEKKENTEFFDYMAFRYFEIEKPENVELFDIKIIARNYPFEKDSTSFVSNNKMLNSIWDICKNGVRTGTQEGYLDCPTREKGLYLGDMTITAQSHFYLTGDLSIWKKALDGFGISTYYNEAINTTCLNHFTHALIDYSFQYPLNLIYYYNHSHDIEFLKEMLPHCESMMKFFKKYEKNGLLYDVVGLGHLVDWPRNPYDFSDGYDYKLGHIDTYGTHNLLNAFYIGSHIYMDKIYEILEIPYESRVDELKDIYIKSFYNKDKKLFKDNIDSDHCSLHGNVIPLFYGINPEESNESITKLIKEKRLNCGVYMAYFVLKGLARINEYKLVYDLLSSDDLFSWSNMVKEGATTCFEAWSKEYKWNTSLCHPWASAPIIILIEDILGFKPPEKGWEQTPTIKSHIPFGLQINKYEFHIKNGKIKNT